MPKHWGAARCVDFQMHHGFEEGLPNTMKKAFKEMGLGEIEVDRNVDDSIKPNPNLGKIDPNAHGSNADFSDVMDLLYQG
jgi:hypothetical protein